MGIEIEREMRERKCGGERRRVLLHGFDSCDFGGWQIPNPKIHRVCQQAGDPMCSRRANGVVPV